MLTWLASQWLKRSGYSVKKSRSKKASKRSLTRAAIGAVLGAVVGSLTDEEAYTAISYMQMAKPGVQPVPKWYSAGIPVDEEKGKPN